ncbi:unnamed protein product [Soboliphyme baturini]|uniref:Uncharacterized protein n=1 Tax=Soboliphyme baturini TaxID=241478 RepID=A0A183IWB3_9BILA|nr:unnamed protein product [Soboliphyme baturini]
MRYTACGERQCTVQLYWITIASNSRDEPIGGVDCACAYTTAIRDFARDISTIITTTNERNLGWSQVPDDVVCIDPASSMTVKCVIDAAD